MESQDVAVVIKSAIETGLVTSEHIIFLFFLIVIFAGYKFATPVKKFFSEALHIDDIKSIREQIDDIKTSNKEEHEKVDDKLLSIDNGIQGILQELDRMKFVSKYNGKAIEEIKNNLLIVKTNIENNQRK